MDYMESATSMGTIYEEYEEESIYSKVFTPRTARLDLVNENKKLIEQIITLQESLSKIDPCNHGDLFNEINELQVKLSEFENQNEQLRSQNNHISQKYYLLLRSPFKIKTLAVLIMYGKLSINFHLRSFFLDSLFSLPNTS